MLSLKEYIATQQHPLIMAFGNPLLDTIVINDNNRLKPLMDRLRLEVDGIVELDRKQMQDIFKSLPEDLPRTTAAGGSSLNSMRFLQKLIGSGDQRVCTYFGAIGNDEHGKLLKELLEAAKIDARLGVVSNYPTGMTLAIVTNENRSLVAHIGAAGKYNKLKYVEDTLPLDRIKILYIEAYFLINNFCVAIEIAKMAESKKFLIAFNLNAEYVLEKHEREILDFIAYSNIVFGNVGEYQALAARYPIEYDRPTDIPFHLNTMAAVGRDWEHKCGRSWLSRSSCFVLSQGGNGPAICVYGENNFVEYKIPTNITVKDTTGAGDALVAGFLAGVLAGQEPQTCLNWGCKVAEEVIQKLGATLPDDLPDDFLPLTPQK
ncbi:adenosine kinase-like [Copidosoma floridanum]|uniref:adenosine kinase-like n=1 Tax=Copidosoma floridanum TaxID=29053 RepID=UPI0006C9D69E|nr:adenosine kinase-like [Copidosoma floridanum]